MLTHTAPNGFEIVACYWDGSGTYAQYVNAERTILVTELSGSLAGYRNAQVSEIIVSELEREASLDGAPVAEYALGDLKLGSRFYATADYQMGALATSAVWLIEGDLESTPQGYFTYWPSKDQEAAFLAEWKAYRATQGASFL